jgi:hypothetical protein
LYNTQQRGNELPKRHNVAEKWRNVTALTTWVRTSTMATMVHCCRDSAVYQNQNLFSSKGVLHPCIPSHMLLQNFILDVKLTIVDKIHNPDGDFADKIAISREELTTFGVVMGLLSAPSAQSILGQHLEGKSVHSTMLQMQRPPVDPTNPLDSKFSY